MQFLLGIVGNLIASFIYDSARGADSKAPPTIIYVSMREPARPPGGPPPPIDQRAVNRENLRRQFGSLVYLLWASFILYLSVKVPLFLSGAFADSPPPSGMFDLSQFKLIGPLLNRTIPMTTVNWVLVFVLPVLFFVFLRITDWLVAGYLQILDRYQMPTWDDWFTARLAFFTILCVLFAGFLLFSISSLRLIDAFMVIFFIIVVLGALIAGDSKRR